MSYSRLPLLGPIVAALLALALLALPGCDCNNGTPVLEDAGPTDGGGDGTDAQAGLKHGILGRYSALAAADGKLLASAYENTYGDLVLVTVSTSDLTTLAKELVDGVPTGSGPKPGEWRDGIEEPGDNVGQDTDIVVNGGQPMISYRDVTNRSLKFAVRSADKWVVYTIQDPTGSKEVVGRYTSMVLVGNRPAIAYLVLNIDAGGGSFSSELRWAAADKAAPTAPGDWTISTIDSGPMACQNLCASGEVCVLAQDGSSSCKTKSTDCTSTCASGEACVSGVCEVTVPDVSTVDVPLAKGLWPSVVVPGGNPVVIYYDRVNGNLMGAAKDGGVWKTAVIKGTTGDHVGAFCSAATDQADTIHVAYQDADAGSLHYVQVDPLTLAPTISEVIDNGVRPKTGLHPVGADAALLVDAAGVVHVVYQDAATTDLLGAERATAGKWTPNNPTDDDLGRLIKGGEKGYGFYSDLVEQAGKLYGSTFFYDQKSNPKGGLEFFALP